MENFFFKLLIKLTRSTKKRAHYVSKLGVKVGKGCEIYTKVSWGSEPYLIRLGDYVKVTSGVSFVTHDGGIHVIRKQKGIKDADCFGRIEIGNNVFIGINSIIMPNVIIGDNCIIGANSVVTKDVPDSTVVAGIPAKKINDIETYYQKIKPKIVQTKGLSYNEKKKILEEKLL